MNGNEQKQNRSSAFDAVLMVALVFSLFTLLCLITRSTLLGELGEVYANFVLGALGFVSYGIMPIIACYSIFQLFSKKTVNSLIVLGSVALYVLGITLIFHILTSSSSDVFAGTMTYADYIDESYFLQASGLYNATAGGAVASAILYYILKNVGIVGANIFCMLIIALATFGVWLVVRKMMPKKAKTPKIKKAKKVKEKKVEPEEETGEYIEYSNVSEPEFFQEEEAPQKRVNALGMEVINPTVGREYPNETPSRDYNARIVREEKPSKLHVVNIEDSEIPTKRKKKPATAQDILFNGIGTVDNTVADHNRVRHLGEMNSVEVEPQRFESSIPTTQSSRFAELFGNQNTKPVQPSNNANAVSNTNFFAKDYQITQTSEFGIVDNTISQPEPKEEIAKPFNDDEDINKKMYSKEMPVNPPKIWTMADLEAKKPKVSEETAVEAEMEAETAPVIVSAEEQALEEARLHREKMDRLKSEMLSPADEKDIENLRQIYPNTNSVDYKRVQNPRIITSLSQLEEESETKEPTTQTNFADLNRRDFIYDVKTDEFIDKESDAQIERLKDEQIKKSQMSSASFGVISDIGEEESEEAPLKTDDDFFISDNIASIENQNSYKAPIGFSKIQPETPKPEEIYKRQNIANPMPISNPDGTKGEQLPIYAEEKVSFNHPYIYPPIDLLEDFEQMGEVDMEDVRRNASLLEQVLENFNIPAKVMDMVVGPTVTKYELEMPQGIQVKRVEGYSKDISMCLESPSEVIIEAPIPGKNRVGIEVPNKIKQVVSLKEVIKSTEFTLAKSKTVFALGKDVTGKNILCDIKDMPHLLIAGATGMGKSVCLNTLIMSLIYHSDPTDLRMLLIDPKKVEFISYKEIPHLLINEIISDNDKAILALGWAIDEMEKRYTMFESVKQKDMDSYNAHIATRGGKKLARIVIVVDEVADLMSINKKEIEGKIQRLTQKARAAGIHLVLATQRPSVDVITGVIKTNLPSRIAFKLSNGIDSKTVIDEGGAERLLGRGDMFYRPASWPAKVRVQGCFVSTPEVDKVIDFVTEHNTCDPDDICYNAIFNANKKTTDYQNGGGDDFEVDEYFKDAVRHAIQTNNITITAIQRRFGLGFPRAGKIFDAMVQRGYVADSMTGKTREILLDPNGFEQEFGEPF